jgi:transposase
VIRPQWPEIAKLSVAGYSCQDVAAKMGLTAGQVEQARRSMRHAGMLPALKRGYRSRAKPEISAAEYATYIAKMLADLHEAKLYDGSKERADEMVKGIVAEIERQTLAMID